MNRSRVSSLRQAFLQRFDFTAPVEFLALAGGSECSVLPVLPEFHWLSADEVAGFRFLEHQWPDFVPFARSTRGHLWCWCPESGSGGKVPVGVCPLDCEEGEIYAPDFSCALFRLICDGARHLSEVPAGISAAATLLRESAALTVPGWPEEWRAWLRRMAENPVSQWRERGSSCFGIIPRSEYDRVIRDWIDDGDVGSVFRWMTAP